jgi:hypothetical protein
LNESHKSGSLIKFHALLLALDERAAERVRAAGCPQCGGRLYAAHFTRKVRGLDDEAAEAGGYGVRLSLCCGRDGCRARATPPSIRFMKGRVYGAVAVLVLSLSGRDRKVSEAVGVTSETRCPSWHTRSRWLAWWRRGLLTTPWFAALCAHLRTPLDATEAPDSLLGRFAGEVCARITHLLVFLAPLTTGSVLPERSRIAMAR